jgi:hypothetical protein
MKNLADVALQTAVLAAKRDELVLAAQLLGASEARRDAAGFAMTAAERSEYDSAAAALCIRLAEDEFDGLVPRDGRWILSRP